jgi:hypothetical protein
VPNKFNRPNKFTYLLVLQGKYNGRWEDLCAADSAHVRARHEIHADLRAYEANEGGEYRIVKRRT